MLREPKRLWSSPERSSSRSSTLPALALDAVCCEEILDGGGNFDDVCFRRKMPGVEELNLRAGYVLSESFRSCGNEERIVLAPNSKQRRFRFAEIFLEFWIEVYVRRVIEKKI